MLTQPYAIADLTIPSTSSFFVPFENGFNAFFMVMFTCNIKKIKGAVHTNGDIDGPCKRAFSNSSMNPEVKVKSQLRIYITIKKRNKTVINVRLTNKAASAVVMGLSSYDMKS